MCESLQYEKCEESVWGAWSLIGSTLKRISGVEKQGWLGKI